MSKRRISDRQAARIQQLQDKRLQKAKQNKSLQAVETQNLGAEQEGLLIANYGAYVDVENKQGDIIRCHLRQNLGLVAAGDHIVWQPSLQDNKTGVVVALKPRQTALTRTLAPGKVKLIAANINQVLLVLAVQPRPPASTIDSYLVAAETVGLKTLIICNKADLLTENPDETLSMQLKNYEKLDYPILYVSAHQKRGLVELKKHLQNHTSIVVGQSGVGKSSLVSCLLPETVVRVDTLSPAGDHGMHTTTTARLYHLPSGGDLIDSPGVREFQLWDMPPDQIAEGFVEFRPHLGRCRFRNCKHIKEENCALQQAVNDGTISPARLTSYQRIVEAFSHNK